MRIAHIADFHIRGSEYLDEIKFTISELIASLKKQTPDLIFIGGDTYHQKLTVTNEYFDICSYLLKELSDISTVIIVLGNHDLALNNKARLDAVTPVIKAIGNTKNPIHFCKHSEDFVKIQNNGLNYFFHNFSILDDKEKWPNQDKIIRGLQSGEYKEADVHIAMYHGAVNGCMVDNGWISRGNNDSIDIFSGFDFALLGDIHKFQMLTDRVAYPGSIRQNNFGEDLDKGYLLWDIDSKEKFSVERIILDQKRYFYTINIKNVDDLKFDDKIKKGSRVRVIVEERVGLVDDAKIRETVKQWYSPINDIAVISMFDSSSIQSITSGDETFDQDNIRLPDVQRKLIKDFFKNDNLTEEQLQNLYELDKKYNSYVDVSVHRNSVWNIQKLKWSNLFSYGSENEIDFTKINGLIGIFGSNGHGKSSIIDSLCYGLYNSINKEGAVKNVDYINLKKKKCEVDIKIEFSGDEYRIKRETHRPSKEGSSPKNEIEFYKKSSGKKISLNGETKPDTNQEIKNIFGSLDDFVSTSLCPQEGLTKFLDVRGTDKKKIFNKFFDLDFFETKHSHAEKDYSAIKLKFKEISDLKLNQKMLDIVQKLNIFENELREFENKKKEVERSLKEANENVLKYTSEIKQTSFSGDIDKVRSDLLNLDSQINEHVEKLDKTTSNYDLQSLNEKRKKILDNVSSLKNRISEIKTVKNKYEKNLESSSLLKSIPCGDKYPTCAFIQNAHKAKEEIEKTDNKIFETLTSLESELKEFESLLEAVENEKRKIETRNNLTLSLENLKLKKESLESQILRYEENKIAISHNFEIYKSINHWKQINNNCVSQLGALNEKINSLNKVIGSLESQKEDCGDKVQELEEIKDLMFYYELYLKAMGKNGISYNVTAQKLPLINEEANKILKHVVNYSVSIEENEEEKSIKIYLTRDKEKTPVELASGAEKTMISLALRTSLWRVTCIPKTPCLILDEPFGFMEEGKHESIVKMLQYLKNYFKHIFIITHDSDLKNVVDFSIYVEKDESGYAKCVV